MTLMEGELEYGGLSLEKILKVTASSQWQALDFLLPVQIWYLFVQSNKDRIGQGTLIYMQSIGITESTVRSQWEIPAFQREASLDKQIKIRN